MTTALHNLIDFLLPPRCPWCLTLGPLPEGEPICRACLEDLHLSPGPWMSNKLPVQACDAVVSVCEFSGRTREVIHRLKYRREPWLAKSCAALMIPHLRQFPNLDGIMAIPMSRPRLRQRRYNQSQRLAHYLSKESAIPLIQDVVSRCHVDQTQTALGVTERWDNVWRQFQVMAPGKIAGQHILLIDDVITTGATVTALAHALKKAGAKTVSALTLAQTI